MKILRPMFATMYKRYEYVSRQNLGYHGKRMFRDAQNSHVEIQV